MFAKFKNHWPIFFLLFTSVILSILNYTPNTFLSGWDTLHPEFNFPLNIQRAIFGVFREEQGLGAVAAHSHMADLPRILLLYVFDIFLPTNFIRYFYIFLNVSLGPIGMYLFLNRHLLKQKAASFLGGLFYLLNFGTLQIFNVPFEMFTTLFATAPFIFYYALNFLGKEKRVQNLLLFSVFVLFTSPSAYAATLWYVFFLCFFIYLLTLGLISYKRDKKHQFKNVFTLILLTLALNIFWIFPNTYFVLNHAKEVQSANINLLFSDQAFLKNKEFGNLSSILLTKIFYFDWSIYAINGFTNLLDPFINHLKNLPILILGYSFGISLILGAIYTLKKLKHNSIPLFILLFISLFFLINDNFPFSSFFKYLQTNIPFFKEALRFPGDKILNIHVFLISIFFGFFSLFLIQHLKKIHKESVGFIVILIASLLVIYNLPSFNGNFINKQMRIDIPKAYFELFDYLKKEKSDAKVANLPIHSPWGWVYYNWYQDKPSFQGAGFLYFGIKQPLLDRDFDRWSPYNESYYRQMSYALYNEDTKLVAELINKYNIGFIFIDKSVIDPQHPTSTLIFKESEDLIKKTNLVLEEKKFGTIKIFKLSPSLKPNFSATNTNINVNPKARTIYKDFAYATFGDYITKRNSLNFNNISYPFRDFIDNQSRVRSDILRLGSDKISLNPNILISNFQTQSVEKGLEIISSDLILQKDQSNLNISIYPNAPVFDDIPYSNPFKGYMDTTNMSSNLVLSVNNKETFNLEDLFVNTPTAVGKVILNNGSNNISLFDKNENIKLENVQTLLNPFFTSCDGQSEPIAGFSQNGINIKGKGNICVLIPLGFFPNENNLLINFGFELNQTNVQIKSCIFDQLDSRCIYYLNPLIQNNRLTFTIPINGKDLQTKALKIFFESKNIVQNLRLTNLNAQYSVLKADIELSKDFISQSFTDENISFKNIYLSKQSAYDPGFEITNIERLENDCGTNSKEIKKEIVKLNGVNVVRYKSNNGNFCDHFSYPNLSHKTGYLIIIDSKNEKGLPLNLCITNYTTRKCDIYTNLSQNTDFEKEVFLLAPTDNKGIGYDINFENIGIAKTPSQNYIKSIEFVPIPFEFLINLSQKDLNLENLYTGKILNISKLNPSMYTIKTDGQPLILNLNYSFEKGFNAYILNCSNGLSCFIKTIFSPFLAKDLEHVLVNNWANGWIIGKTPQDMQIVVIYIPQYLETLGLILVAVIFLILSSLVVKNRHQ